MAPPATGLETLFQRALSRHRDGRRAEAASLYRQVLAAAPKAPAPLFFLGLLEAQGGEAAGLGRMEKALRLDPGNAAFWQNYAVMLQQAGRIDEAARAFRRCATLDPGNVEAALGLGNIARLQDDVATAVAEYRRALALRPDALGAKLNLGTLLAERGDHEEGLVLLADAAAAAPEEPLARLNYAGALAFHDRTQAAQTEFAAAAVLRPQEFGPKWRALHALPLVYPDEAARLEWRQRWSDALQRIEESLDLATPARIAEAFEALKLATGFYLPYAGRFEPPLDEASLQRRVAAVVTRIAHARLPHLVEPPKGARGRRLRVGFVSHHFRQHSILKTHGAWVTGLDPARFEVIAIQTGPLDEATRRLGRGAVRLLHRPVLTDAFLAELRGLALDVLVYPDIGMEPLYQILAALRLAPVQVNGLGHPVTSGFATINVALSSTLMEPDDGERHYTERIVRLPNAAYSYDGSAARAATAEFDRDGAPLVYACVQNLAKLLPAQDALFARISAEVPDAVFWFVATRSPVATEHFRARLARAFAAAGADPARIRILPMMEQQRFFAMLRAADILLDGLAWSGCNTSFEALALGRPVLTLPGAIMRARHTAAILTLGGLEALIARNEADWVGRAVRLGTERAWRREVEQDIGAAQGKIFDDPAPLAGLAAFLDETRG